MRCVIEQIFPEQTKLFKVIQILRRNANYLLKIWVETLWYLYKFN